jgi:Flp pilus assembly protein TadG
MKKMFYEEKGQSLVLVAVFLIILIAFTGLAIDGGRLYIAKAKLQKAVDAGALAGADVMVNALKTSGNYNYSDSMGGAESIANTNYSKSNSISQSDISYNATFPGNTNVIQVNGQETVPLMLMPVLGLNSSTVSAVAQVKVGKLNSLGTGVVIPIGIQLNQSLTFGSEWSLTDSPGNGVKGWYNFLDFSFIDPNKSSSGNKSLSGYISSGAPAPIQFNDKLNIQTGVAISNNVITAINSRLNQIVYVPVVEPDPTDSKKVIVKGFAAFQLESYDDKGKDHVIKAIFNEVVKPGDIGAGVSPYGTYASPKLIM